MTEPPADRREQRPPDEPSSPPPISPASDDAPTIISRLLPRAARPEDVFTTTLRGRRLAHFELLDPFGVGGMAAVIRARDAQLDRTVALKVLPPEMATDQQNVNRFQYEARAAAKLDHENIARVFYCGEDQGLHFIAFEFVDGENLRDILERRGRVSVAEAVACILQIADGLAHASARGVIHRDIKPSNIIISETGRAKLVDMGLARSLERESDHALTQSGVTLGSFDYISPEQALEPREADVRSDIYSLGCTFYHMLTGRPSVPEGTAAKKLHHHHQVAPTAAQWLNPEVPDDVADIMMRMMAKDPADRYQRAEDLVQALLPIAQRLGVSHATARALPAAHAVPFGRSRGRSALVASFIAAVLLIFGALHVLFPWPVRSPRTARGEIAPADRAEAGTPSESLPSRTNPHEPFRKDVATTKELAECLADLSRQRPAVANIFLTNDLDLSEDAPAPENPAAFGLVVDDEGGKLIIGPREGFGTARRPTIRFMYDPNLPRQSTDPLPIWTALTIKGGNVVLRGLRFEVNAASAQVIMAAVKLQGAGRLVLENCEFVQINPPETNQGQMASVLVENTGAGSSPKLLEIKNCYFGVQETGAPNGPAASTGQSAVTVTGPATVRVADCAFGPHAALFQLRSGTRQEKIDLSLHNCSAFLVDSSAFQISDSVYCRLDVQKSIFSRPTSAVIAGAGATLIQQMGEARDIRFDGYDNRYHNLSAFWLKSASPMLAATPYAGTWDQFQKAVWPDGIDKDSRVVSVSPWADKKDPLRWLKKEPQEPGRAFQVDTRMAEMRQVDNRATRLVGVENCTWGIIYDSELPPLDEPKTEVAAEKIVDPKFFRTSDGVYPTLSQAVGEARPGDVILVRHTGLLKVDPIYLERANVNLTIKPYPESHPILTLGETSQVDASLFHLHEGTLKLEGMECSLRSSRDEFTAQAVVDLVGNGQCLLKDCVITLEEPRKAHLALARLTQPSGIMKLEPQFPHPSAPLVHLERCFVRGEGNVAAIHGNRSLDLQVEDSLVALEGSFLNVDGAGKDPATVPPIQVKLTRVTTYLTEHLVRLSAPDPHALIPVLMRPVQDCLFASTGGKALVQLDGLDTNQAQLKGLFLWEGKQNIYSKFEAMVDQKSGREEATTLGQEKWKTFTGETDSQFTSVKFAEAPQEQYLAKAMPANFRVKWETEQPGCGAAIDQLPPPHFESGGGGISLPLPR